MFSLKLLHKRIKGFLNFYLFEPVTHCPFLFLKVRFYFHPSFLGLIIWMVFQVSYYVSFFLVLVRHACVQSISKLMSFGRQVLSGQCCCFRCFFALLDDAEGSQFEYFLVTTNIYIGTQFTAHWIIFVFGRRTLVVNGSISGTWEKCTPRGSVCRIVQKRIYGITP